MTTTTERPRCAICGGTIPTAADIARYDDYEGGWSLVFCTQHDRLINANPKGRPSAGWAR